MTKITKKAEAAARIEANKRAAYLKKVQTLVGYVGPRITTEMAIAAMAAEKTAESYAAELAALEPVGKAVFPVKLDSVKAANEWATSAVARMTKDLEAAGWDLNIVAPRPKSTDSRRDYKVKGSIRANFARITKTKGSAYARTGWESELIVEIDPEGVARFIAMAERDAADVYDTFACKLVAKVGPCDSAELEGSHVWSHSILTVRKGATIERWKTQQIENVSVLGKYFPQWPTRLLKGEG